MTTYSKDAAFWSKISRKYAARPIGNLDGYHYTLERTKSYLRSSDRVLEMGCGTGSTALLLAPHVGHITGTDLSPGMIEIANEKSEAEGPENIAFRVAEIQEHALSDDPFDMVMAHNLLHLVPDLEMALAHVANLTKPGGYFVSKTVCAPRSGGFRFALIRRVAIPLMQAFGKAPFVSFLPIETLDQTIENAGFRIVETSMQEGTLPSRYIVAVKKVTA